jgi:hypothetical protein
VRQAARQLALSAERRQREGEALVQAAETLLASTLSPEAQAAARRQAPAVVARLMDACWPTVDPFPDFYALLADRERLRRRT